MPVVNVRKVGKSLAFVLPPAVTTDLGVRAGDTLHLLKTRAGFELRQLDAQAARQLRVAMKGMRKYRNALRQLADS